MKKWLQKKRKPKAGVFVDYEHLFYSDCNIWGFQPNVSVWTKELKEKYRIEYIEFFADFVMLDHIYRSAVKYSRILNYVLFTGEDNFKAVMKFLRERKKNVISYGVSGAYSGLLREAANETVTIPDEEDLFALRDYIIDNLAYVVGNGKIIPIFSGTIEAVSEKHGLQPQAVKRVLIRLIDLTRIN